MENDRNNNQQNANNNGFIRPGIGILGVRHGTLGAIVWRGDTQFLLSCWHVLARTVNTVPGRLVKLPNGAKIAKYEAHAMGSNLDAAIAKLITSQVNIAQDITGAIIKTSRPVREGDILIKVGATTKETRAKVVDLHVPHTKSGVPINCFRLKHEVKSTEKISDSGDSGALWYDPETNEGVGLHIVGERNGPEYAFACPLDEILMALNVTLAQPSLPMT